MCCVASSLIALLLVYGFGLRGFAMVERICSGVLRECSFLKYVWRTSRVWLGFAMISFVLGSLMVDSSGWFLDLGWKPAAVLRFWW
jgi:hypothetical protein